MVKKRMKRGAVASVAAGKCLGSDSAVLVSWVWRKFLGVGDGKPSYHSP